MIASCIFNSLSAQTQPDAGSWNAFNVDYEINDKWTAVLTQEFRLKENLTRLNLFYTNIGVEYEAIKNLKTNLVYRSIQKFRDDNTFSFRHRLQWDVTFKFKSGNFEMSLRHRLQSEIRNVYSSATGKLPEWYSRSRFQIKYDLDKPYTPYFSFETRYQLHDPRNQESDQTLHRNRYQLGIDYKLNKRNTFGVYYLIQSEFNISDPEDLYIIGLEYSLKLK